MTSLKDQLKAATSETEVQELILLGNTYEYASQATRNSWHNISQRKLKVFRKDAKLAAKGNTKKEPALVS